MDFTGIRIVVVGSGFFGAVIAERVASELDLPVLVLEKRTHIGGNSFSELDSESGVEFHRYGSHIFHTSNEDVWRYITGFSPFNTYQHRVFTQYSGKVYTMPINLKTINDFYGLNLKPAEAKKFITAEIAKHAVTNPKNLEEKAISLIGKPLYEAFIKGYSEKQWETALTNLPPHIITRLPVRFSFNDRYFDDTFEGMPILGYGKIFEKMLSHPKITVKTGIDFFSLRNQIPANCLVVYTGPIDRFFDYRHGKLTWRTLRFEKEVLSCEDYQGCSVLNYADRSIPYTRIHEFKHFHPERRYTSGKTLIYREYSKFAQDEEEPYYPVNTDSDKAIFQRYSEEMAKQSNVVFGGRLATYKYLDMHQVIGAALLSYRQEVRRKLVG